MKRVFGSVRNKLSRSSSIKSQSSAEPVPVSSGTNPFIDPAPTATRRPPKNEPPPAYTAVDSSSTAGAPIPIITTTAPTGSSRRDVSPAPSTSSRITVDSVVTADDQFAFLKQFDTIFLIDDSGSMAGRSWREVDEAIRAITPICVERDSDGIDVYFLNATNSRDAGEESHGRAPGGWRNIRSAAQVERLFAQVRPRGTTPTGTRIDQILRPYVRHFEARARATGAPEDCGVKPINMIVVTDGVPTDDPESVIAAVAAKLDKADAPPYQVGIQFFQVGAESGAREALQELDDGLASMHDVRDMVDTVSWSGEAGSRPVLSADAILKTVLGAVVKRLDRRSVADGRRLAPR